MGFLWRRALFLSPRPPPSRLLRRRKVTVARSGRTLEPSTEPGRLRNVGIMAHIDAGKTTTTERFLFYSGVIGAPGEVHHGDTVTDFLPQERERGITIQSALVSFPWRNSKVNLIDTPGHVDFTFEVQRSLRVVDSAVAILDASAGVEAQTLTVWRQAAEYRLPRIIYLNKMDKTSASVDMCLSSIVSKLKCVPLLVQEPFYAPGKEAGSSSGLRGLIDLVEMRRLLFDPDSKGVKIIQSDVSADPLMQRKRGELIERVADLDSTLASIVIERESLDAITRVELYEALRRVTLSAQGVPVLLGSSYKNVGVQPLMDSLLLYLPSPEEALALVQNDPVLQAYGKELCAFAFKTMHDPQLGSLTFLRLFSGRLAQGQRLYNVSRGKHEKVGKIYLPLGEELSETPEVGPGEVVMVSGLKETWTGDTLCPSTTVSSAVSKKMRAKGEPRVVLSGVTVPEPVFMCSIEPASISQQKVLEASLEILQKQDPSLHVHTDPDTNQIILSGMGELHIEIIHNRLKTEFKADADLGKIQVAYKETIANPVQKRTVFERRLADHNHKVCLELELVPSPQSTSRLKLYKGKDKDKGENLSRVSEAQIRHIQNGLDSAIRFGPKLSFPLVDLDIILHWFELGRGTSDAILEAAAATALRETLSTAHIYLMEPIVRLEITVDEGYQRVVLDDLNRRRFTLEEIDLRHGNKIITGTAPLSKLLGYSTILRTISSGLATFSMQFSHNQLVNDPSEEEKIIVDTRGF